MVVASMRDKKIIKDSKNMKIPIFKLLNYKITRIIRIRNNTKMTNLFYTVEIFKKKEKILSDWNVLLKSIKTNCCKSELD